MATPTPGRLRKPTMGIQIRAQPTISWTCISTCCRWNRARHSKKIRLSFLTDRSSALSWCALPLSTPHILNRSQVTTLTTNQGFDDAVDKYTVDTHDWDMYMDSCESAGITAFALIVIATSMLIVVVLFATMKNVQVRHHAMYSLL